VLSVIPGDENKIEPQPAWRMACGDVNEDDAISSSDALIVLRRAVGISGLCDRNCRCDVDCTRTITTGDALQVLRVAVEPAPLRCCYISGCNCYFPEETCEPDPDWPCYTSRVPQ
jgi:hypothetical protein